MAAVTNSSLIPSPNDLLMAFPRLAQKVGTFAFFHMPEQVDAVLNKIMNGGSIIADATATNVTTASITTASSAFAQDTAAALAAQDPLDSGFFAWMADAINFEGFRGFGGMLSYFGSRWALATFMVVGLLLASGQEHADSHTIVHLPQSDALLRFFTPESTHSVALTPFPLLCAYRSPPDADIMGTSSNALPDISRLSTPPIW